MRYARSLTDIEVRGNAWAWWGNAAGSYQRGQAPAEGAVLVFRRGAGGMRLGHVSAVTGIVDARTILVTHSFGGATLWRDVPIVDVSAANNWTLVRVWHGPTRQMGTTEFATYGFIYPHGAQPEPALARVAAEEALALPEAVSRNPAGAGIDWDWLASVPLPEPRPRELTESVAVARDDRRRFTETAEYWGNDDAVGPAADDRDWRQPER